MAGYYLQESPNVQTNTPRADDARLMPTIFSPGSSTRAGSIPTEVTSGIALGTKATYLTVAIQFQDSYQGSFQKVFVNS
jgi:hypothetical protein